MNFLKKCDKILTRAEEILLFTVTMIGLIVLFVAIVLRYSINYTLSSASEIMREVIIISTFIGLSLGVKNRAMLKIDVLPQIFPKLKKALEFISNLSILVFGVVIVYYGWQMVEQQAATHQTTILLRIPLQYLYMVLPVTGFLMIIRVLQVIYEDLSGKNIFTGTEEPVKEDKND